MRGRQFTVAFSVLDPAKEMVQLIAGSLVYTAKEVVAELPCNDIADVVDLTIGVDVRVPRPLVDFVARTLYQIGSGYQDINTMRGIGPC